MREYRLFNGRPERQASRRQWVDELVPTPGNAFKHLEFDIKYMHIRGQRRNAMMLTVIDVWSGLMKMDTRFIQISDCECTHPQIDMG